MLRRTLGITIESLVHPLVSEKRKSYLSTGIWTEVVKRFWNGAAKNDGVYSFELAKTLHRTSNGTAIRSACDNKAKQRHWGILRWTLIASIIAVSRHGVWNGRIPVSDAFSIVCADDADMTFRSCDGTLFKVHRKNLETSSEGFSPPPGTSSRDEIVSLTENRDTLDLLFQYIYPQRQPDLAEIDFKQLAELSEAAEKYQVFSAMTQINGQGGEDSAGGLANVGF
ncbi:hypothetical protein HWV62_6327 [Athelia sp. TMB]|nr:hypothetical protein HWV62_6327 [Athelia sp. TMB]